MLLLWCYLCPDNTDVLTKMTEAGAVPSFLCMPRQKQWLGWVCWDDNDLYCYTNKSSLQGECSHLLQLLLAVIEFDVKLDCCRLHSLPCCLWSSRRQLQLGDGASYVFLYMWAFSWYGLCLISWPQPATTVLGGESHLSQCIALGLLWSGPSSPRRWLCCLAFFLLLSVWRARLLSHFPEDHSGWHLAAVLPDLVQAFCEMSEFVSCCGFQDWQCVGQEDKLFGIRCRSLWRGGNLHKSLNFCLLVGTVADLWCCLCPDKIIDFAWSYNSLCCRMCWTG